MKIQYTLADGGKTPTQGYAGDVAHDTYVREDAFIVGGALTATKIKLGLHTAFDSDKYAVLVSPRGAFSKLPLALANSVGLVEGTYRGEYLALVRANVLASGLSKHVITLDDNGDITTLSLEDALKDEGIKKASQEAKKAFLKDTAIMNVVVGRDAPKDVLENLFEEYVPSGTVLIKKDTRLVQVWAVQKETISFELAKELGETERGNGAVGSSGVNHKTQTENNPKGENK